MNHLNKLFIATIIFFAGAFQLIAVENGDIPTLDELKLLHIESNIGQYSLNSLKSVFASGRILYYTEDEVIERGFRIYKKRPNKYRSFYETKLEKKLVQLEVIYDGENAVQIVSHGGREVYRENLQDDALESIKFESKIEGPFLLVTEEEGKYITVEGYEYIEDQKCILLSVDERSQYPYRKIWLSADNFQEIKYDHLAVENDQDMLEEVYFRNFKSIEGIIFATRIDKYVNGKRKFATFIDDFNVNYGLYDSLFEVDSK
jgi:outer membrane lipoprotein-sorting protein